MATVPPAVLPSGEIFAPVLPDAATLLGFGSILLLSALAVSVWSNQVVPVARTNLAMSKQRGPVRDYLDELREAEAATEQANSDDPSLDNRAFERWLFADWLRNEGRKAGRQKEPALPILKSAKWNSGDNPVLLASALIALAVIVSSLVERTTVLLHL